jgi:hypothetical protein
VGRKEHNDGSALIWGPSGAVFITQPAPKVLYLIGLGNFDGPFEDGPMCDFDRVIAEQGSLDLFLDVRGVDRGSRKSRGPWKEWAGKNSARHKSFVLVRSSLLHMAISVIAMASKTVTQSYSNEHVFLSELMRKAPNMTGLPTVPAWASAILRSSQKPPALDPSV